MLLIKMVNQNLYCSIYGKPELALMNSIDYCSRKSQTICSTQCRSYRECHMAMWSVTLKSQSNRTTYIYVEFTYRYDQWGQIWVWIMFLNTNTGQTQKPVNNFCFYAMKYIAHISYIIDDNRVCCASDHQVRGSTSWYNIFCLAYTNVIQSVSADA